MKIVQRSPNVGIGIRLKKESPEAPAQEVAPPVPPAPLTIYISDAITSTAGGVASSVQYVNFSEAYETDQLYKYTLENVTVDASEFVVDSVDFTAGVYIAGADIINVPAGVKNFEVTVTITSTYVFEIRLQVQILNVFGLTIFQGV